jgi:hypothetical protein
MVIRRASLLLVLLVAAAPWLAFAVFAEPDKKPSEFAGKVVPLADLLDKSDVKLDKDAAAYWLALKADDGKVYPLVKDPGSRMFFKDRQLLNRAVRLTGRLVGNANMLQVLSVRTVVNGKLHEPYYWCDICKIKRFEPNACDCCGAPLEFREEAVEK